MVPGGVYPQRFGIPEGLYAEPVAVKQGWMCCVGSDWARHLSTGVIGAGSPLCDGDQLDAGHGTRPTPARPSPRP